MNDDMWGVTVEGLAVQLSCREGALHSMNESRKDAMVRQTVGTASVFWLFIRSTLDVRVLVLPRELEARAVPLPVAVTDAALVPVPLAPRVNMFPPETTFSLVDQVL